MMLRRLLVFRSVLLLVAAPVLAQERGDAMLVLADDGSLDPSAVHAIRNIAAAELRKHGVALADDRRTEGVRAVDRSLSTLADEMGARRLFALRVGGRLGQKIPLSLEELQPASLAPVYSASMTAVGLEECDVVTARLVESVVDRRSVESTAGMKTVTSSESKPFAKKPGERFWFIGLPIALYKGGSPFGFSIEYGYEGENFRLGATAGGFGRSADGVAYAMFEASWIPFDGEISPFVGGGMGYMGNGKGGMGGMLEAGVEAFRLHGVRAMAGVQTVIPFYDTTHYDSSVGGNVGGRSIFPAGFMRVAF